MFDSGKNANECKCLVRIGGLLNVNIDFRYSAPPWTVLTNVLPKWLGGCFVSRRLMGQLHVRPITLTPVIEIRKCKNSSAESYTKQEKDDYQPGSLILEQLQWYNFAYIQSISILFSKNFVAMESRMFSQKLLCRININRNCF